MTKLTRKLRIRISSLVFRIHRARSCYWRFMAHLLASLAEGILSLDQRIIRLDQRRSRRKFEKLMNAVADWKERVTAIMPEVQTLGHLTESRKNQVLAASSALLDERKYHEVSASKLMSSRSPTPGLVVLRRMVAHVQIRLDSIQGKTHSFLRIISRIDCDTFYGDLLLWLILPGSYEEALLGDLNEEYLLRRSTEGEARARAWYGDQVARTLKDCVWEKIERLAAIGTLIDLFCRWFGK
jgi:hypothetical protein